MVLCVGGSITRGLIWHGYPQGEVGMGMGVGRGMGVGIQMGMGMGNGDGNGNAGMTVEMGMPAVKQRGAGG